MLQEILSDSVASESELLALGLDELSQQLAELQIRLRQR